LGHIFSSFCIGKWLFSFIRSRTTIGFFADARKSFIKPL
jgi:hypothetical protein